MFVGIGFGAGRSDEIVKLLRPHSMCSISGSKFEETEQPLEEWRSPMYRGILLKNKTKMISCTKSMK